MYEIEVTIREPKWEADEYGCPTYDAGSIMVPVILAIKHAGNYSLHGAKTQADARYPDGVKGRTVMTFIGDDAVLGRLCALEWKRAEQRANGMPQLVNIMVTGVREIGGYRTPIVVQS